MKYEYSNYICYEFKNIDIPKKYDKLREIFSVPIEIKLCLLYSLSKVNVDLYVVIYVDNNHWTGYLTKTSVDRICESMYDNPDVAITKYLL